MSKAKIHLIFSACKGPLLALALLLCPFVFFQLKLWLASILNPILMVGISNVLLLCGFLLGAGAFFAFLKLTKMKQAIKFSVLAAVLVIGYLPWLLLIGEDSAASVVFGFCIGGTIILAGYALTAFRFKAV